MGIPSKGVTAYTFIVRGNLIGPQVQQPQIGVCLSSDITCGVTAAQVVAAHWIVIATLLSPICGLRSTDTMLPLGLSLVVNYS